jgi:hypothetical protein
MTNRIIISDRDAELVSYVDGIWIFEPKIPVLNDAEIMDLPLRNAKLPEGCKINGIPFPKMDKFAGGMRKIYSSMDFDAIQDNTTFNITTEKRNTEGYHYHPALGFSYQSKDTKGTLREIIQMCRVQNYSLEMKIQLKDGRIVLFRM